MFDTRATHPSPIGQEVSELHKRERRDAVRKVSRLLLRLGYRRSDPVRGLLRRQAVDRKTCNSKGQHNISNEMFSEKRTHQSVLSAGPSRANARGS